MKTIIYMLFLSLPMCLFAQQQAEVCSDTLDNDNDGLYDCADPDCSDEAACENAIPCTKNSVFYQVLGGDRFVSYDPAALQYTDIHTNPYTINAIGYNVHDGFIYGIKQRTNELVKVGKDGVFDNLGAVVDLPPPLSGRWYVVGDFDLDGNLYVYHASLNSVYRIDVTDRSAAAIALKDDMGALTKVKIADFSFLPDTEKLYGLESGTASLFSIDLAGNVEELGPPSPLSGDADNNPAGCNSGFGASFADNSGSLYFFCNADGDLFKIDPDNMISELLQATGDTLFVNDGAACALSDSLVIPDGAYCCEGENLIENGNFESGDTGFQSDYKAVIKGFAVDPSEYAVIDFNDADSVCAEWEVADHTWCVNGGGNNQILVVNGQTQQSANVDNVIWQTAKPVQVEPDSMYKFCFFANHLPQCCFDIVPELSVEVRDAGTIAWMPIVPAWTSAAYTGTEPPPCDWEKISGTFEAQTGAVEIRILLNETGNGDGNDLALDDISLTKIPKTELSIEVSAKIPSNPLQLQASINDIVNTDDVLPSPECEYLWAIVEVTDLSPLNLDWGQTMNNGWYGGSSAGHAWGLTTDFPGISLPGDKLYRVYLCVYDCDCLAEASVFEYSGGAFSLDGDSPKLDLRPRKANAGKPDATEDFLKKVLEREKNENKQ